MKLLLLAAGIGLLLLAALGVRRDLSPEQLGAYFDERSSRYRELGGLTVHYRVEGVGSVAPTVVLLHGTGASLHTWDGWVAALAPDHRVVRMDLPGFGLTGPAPGDRYAPEDDVAFLDGFFEALGLETFALAGNSLGGEIALRYTLERPERVSHLILVDSAGLPHRPIRALDLVTWPVVGHLARWITPRAGTARLLKAVYADDSKVTRELVTRYHRLLLRRGNRAALRARRLALRPSLAARLAEIEVPTLVLWGEQDPWLPVSVGERFRDAIAGSKLVRYPDLGHVPMEEAPERTARDVRAFLAGAR